MGARFGFFCFFFFFFLSKQVSPAVQIIFKIKKRKRSEAKRVNGLFLEAPSSRLSEVYAAVDTHFLQLQHIWNSGVVPLVLHAK